MKDLLRLINKIEDLEHDMGRFIGADMQYIDINETLMMLTRLRIALEQETRHAAEN